MCVHVCVRYGWRSGPEAYLAWESVGSPCLPCTYMLSYKCEGPGTSRGWVGGSPLPVDLGGGCLKVSVSDDRHCRGGHPALEAACRVGPETTGLGWGELGPSRPLCTTPSSTGPLPLPLAQLSPLLRSWASQQLA